MYKQVIVVRTDLKMSKGKTAAQASHAAVDVLDKVDGKIISFWKKNGQKKVVLKVGSEDALIELKEKCSKFKIPCSLIKDAGRTEIEQGTITALAIGPDTEERVNKVTGSLPLLK